jgi:hypothetical protein
MQIVTNGTSNSNAATPVTSLASTLVVAKANNLLIVCGAWGSTTDATISDTAGNSWTLVNGKTSTGQYYVFWALSNGTGSTTITVSGASSTYNSIYSTEYDDANSSPYDTNSFTFGVANNTNPMDGSVITTAVNNELLIVVGDIAQLPPALTDRTNFTLRKTNSDNAQVMEDAKADLAGNYTPSFTASSTAQNWGILAVAFKPKAVKTKLLKR